MTRELIANRLSLEEWETACHIVDVVRRNDLGTTILIYFENDFSAVDTVESLGELTLIPPLTSATIEGLARKEMISIDFRHGREVVIIKLHKEIFTAVDARLERDIDSLP